jgi:hypothetical protein
MHKKETKRRLRGVAILDAVIEAGLLIIGAVAYFSLAPVTAKSEYLARQNTIAVQIANRVVEQVQLLTPADLTYTTLNSLTLIDSTNKTSPYSITSFPMDDGWNMSPAKALPSGTGTLAVTDLTNGSKLVTVTINWKSYGGSESYTTGTVLGGYR